MSAADPGPAWTAWARVMPVTTYRAAPAPYLRVRVPFVVPPAEDGGYPDLRVIDAGGREVPYALDPPRPAAEGNAVPLTDVGFIPRRGTQGVVDLGTSRALVGSLVLETDVARRPTFFERVAVDASDDLQTWRIVRDDAVIYRVAQDGGRGSALVRFAPTRSRWLRVRVLDPTAAFPLTGARIAVPASHEPALVPVPVPPAPQAAAAPGDQRWRFRSDTAMRPAAVSFNDGGAFYERQVTVEAVAPGATPVPLAAAAVSHFAEGGAQTTVPLTETTTGEVLVTVHNGNDAPLVMRPELLARPHEIVFPAGREPYRILFGNPAAEAPSYDLRARLAHEDWTAADARGGAVAQNATYRDPRTVGRRFPWLVTGALIVVAVLLGAIALQTVRRAPAA